MVERNAVKQQLHSVDKKICDLEAKLNEEGHESSDLDTLHQRLSKELEDERKQTLVHSPVYTSFPFSLPNSSHMPITSSITTGSEVKNGLS